MIEFNKIYNCDCLEVLKEMPDRSVDLFLQDPPYDTTACSWEWDILGKRDEFWNEWIRILKPSGVIAFTASQPFTSKLICSNLKMFKHEWVWDKVIPRGHLVAKKRPMQQTESVVIFGNGPIKYYPQMTLRDKPVKGKEGKRTTIMGGESTGFTKIYTHKYPVNLIQFKPDHKKLHPTQKPVALFEYLIKTYTNEGDVIFDGFAGCGTTAVASKNLNRTFICCELDAGYYEIAIRR